MLVVVVILSLLLGLFLLELLAARCTSVATGDFARWHVKWPAISEDEFVKKCGPCTDREKALRVRRIISEQLGIEYDHIHPEQSFVNDLGCE